MARQARILSLNAGSSSLKLAIHVLGRGREERVAEGEVERIGSAAGRLTLVYEGREAEHAEGEYPDLAAAVAAAFAALGSDAVARIDAVGHRVVHGGPHLTGPRRIDDALVAELHGLARFAPLHQPGCLEAIAAARRHLPAAPQVACFDTAFHRRMPEDAQRLPLPDRLWDAGVRRYGFHGLSFESIVSQLGPELAPRSVIAHLGSGASLVALADGRPMDTTMGMTPAGGIMMGTRSGDLDPGVLVALLRQEGWNADRLEQLVYREAGLLGVSGTTSDMRELLARRERDPRAARAVGLFCAAVRKAVAALAAALGGLDLLVFTGAIGENSEVVRREVTSGLGFLGIGAAARCAVRVVRTDENLVIARHTWTVLDGGA